MGANKLDFFYELKKEITVEDFHTTLSYYGKEVRKNSFLCPFHHDRHYGSCVIGKDGKRAYCYVCQRSINSIELVEYFEGMEGQPAIEFLWTTILGRTLPSFEGRKRFFLDSRELEAIGISKPSGRHVIPCNAAHKSEKLPEGLQVMKDFCDQDGICAVGSSVAMPSLYRLYDEEPGTVLWLLEKKALEIIDAYCGIMEECWNTETSCGRICAGDVELREETLYRLHSEKENVKIILKKIERETDRLDTCAMLRKAS